MPTIHLVRHAQASFGAADYDVLSERGHAQAAALDRTLTERGIVPARVVAGPARRHRDTAAGCPTLAAADVEVDQRWDEYPADEVLARHGRTAVRLEGADAPRVSSAAFQAALDDALRAWIAADDELWRGFVARVRGALAELAGALGRGERAVVVTSGGAIAAVCGLALGALEAAFVALNRVQVNTGLTTIAVGARGLSLIAMNEHGHLLRDGGRLVTYR